jgi:large subunit ribosomal protein L13
MSKFKTWTARQEDLKGDWYVVDATGMALGRLASNVAKILKGKHKPTYTPHLNTGDHVIVVNASRLVVTGGKMDDKVYTRYTGYPSGLRTRTLRKQRDLDPTFPIHNAVKGMLQHNTLGSHMLKRLRVYAGPEHEHEAQRPRPITFDDRGDIRVGAADPLPGSPSRRQA